MITKNLNDYVKNLPTLPSSLYSFRSLILDVSGGVYKGIQYLKSDRSGANLLRDFGAKGIAFVIAVDNNNKANYLVYVYIKIASSDLGNVIVLANNVIAVQAHNQQSTVALFGASDITQHVFSFPI